MPYDSLWTDEEGRIHTTPSNLVANRIHVKPEVRYSFADRPFMKQIFDDPHRRLAMKTGRQVGKSTWLGSRVLTACEAHGPYNVLILTPSEKQSRVFSYDRLQPTIDHSPAVRALIGSVQDNVFEKGFHNGSKIYITYARDNADRARGITADEIIYDEVQDMSLAPVEAVTKESLFTSPFKRRCYSGTPKSFSNGIEQRVWRRSDQREWMVRCHKHGGIPYHQALTMKNVGLKGPICDKCGGALNTLDGLWVRMCEKTSEGKTPLIHGYHIPQIIFSTTDCEVAPGIFGFLDWRDFLDDLDVLDEATILNEKFGESADSEERPVKESELRRVCDELMDMPVMYEDRMIGEPAFAGIDWGYGLKSATVLSIGQFDPGDPKKFRYVFFRRYDKRDADPNICIPDILHWMQVFRVARCHADFGSGLGLNSQIEDARGLDFITTNYWSSSINGKKVKFDEHLNRYVLNRSVHITRFFQAFKRQHIQVAFKWADFQTYAKDILHVFREERKNGDPYYDHKPDEPDDSMHAMIYCWLIASFVKYKQDKINLRGDHDPYRS